MNAISILKKELVGKKILFFDNFKNEIFLGRSLKIIRKEFTNIQSCTEILDVIPSSKQDRESYGVHYDIVTKIENFKCYFHTEIDIIEY